MIKQRRLPAGRIMQWGAALAFVPVLWALAVFFAYSAADLEFLRVPFLPISTLGTALAFYVGFKNNSAYDRFWEGRKIWGGVVNVSRTWANNVMAYVDADEDHPEREAVRRELIYRHLAWVNALRLQLRRTSRFLSKPSVTTAKRLRDHGSHMRNNWDQELSPFLSETELRAVSDKLNPATHLVVTQGQLIARLKKEGRVDLFHQIELMKNLEELYTLQGKCERIKNTPLPRQYADYSRVLTNVFSFLVPLGMLDVFGDQIRAANPEALWISLDAWRYVVPMLMSSALVVWAFRSMESIGDASEDPFERSMNDVPMNALSRTIERDLRQLLGETDIPPAETPADGILY
jgi:putative membrane protein